jgi:hypothetical protein
MEDKPKGFRYFLVIKIKIQLIRYEGWSRL